MKCNHHWRLFSLLREPVAVCLLIVTGGVIGSRPSAAAETDTPRQSTRQALLDQYCAPCHNQKSRTAGVVLENSGPENPASHAKLWEKVVHKLDAGEMPPPGVPRPDKTSLKAFAAGLIGDLDAAARKSPYAGRPVIRRLNRLEYANSIRDLLAIEVPVADELPPDGIAAGFDNIGDALSMSPLLLEQYLKVARKVSELVVGVNDPSPVTET
ncbi:MAG: DUF1587 domain-containing protein, partial [Bryobacteraceae bacterium]